ncbi:helix-turn-helix domain-containing protein [Flagellimonas sp.]|uniref:helix-turn-helix domain-containing protein n=1 Tax=Flagellimonas sp. TaxID=2058762 RepID=UPI003B522473
MLRSNVPHCWKNHSSSDNRSVSNVVQWDKGIFAKIPELQPLFSLLGIASRGILFDLEGSKTLEKEIKKMPNLVGSNLYSALLKNLLKLTELSYTTLSEASFRDHMPSEFGTRMSKVHNFTERNYHRKIYLRELSDLINISEQSFARFFTKVMGRSFFVFLNEYRIKMAAKQLVDTDDSVAQIGFSCGFESPPFFFKKFKEAYGISPGKFRKKFRKGL